MPARHSAPQGCHTLSIRGDDTACEERTKAQVNAPKAPHPRSHLRRHLPVPCPALLVPGYTPHSSQYATLEPLKHLDSRPWHHSQCLVIQHHRPTPPCYSCHHRWVALDQVQALAVSRPVQQYCQTATLCCCCAFGGSNLAAVLDLDFFSIRGELCSSSSSASSEKHMVTHPDYTMPAAR